ncbi:hypothetical protein SEUCBS140593_008093 [Sporothrix eucalyptigena]|uniref:Uncharacterized protein n=1 Tax=Sporothrix eucalyptigena TaxID=1812306 RepID=A0ABP0CL59_9PEZI
MGYFQCQNTTAKYLAEIDRLRGPMKRPSSVLMAQMQLVPAYAHQSVMIENNSLSPGNSLDMFEELKTGIFSQVSLPSFSIQDQAEKKPLLKLTSFVAGKDVSDPFEQGPSRSKSHKSGLAKSGDLPAGRRAPAKASAAFGSV